MAAVKALQQWCRRQCEGYRDVSITNMTTSFRDGLAFCALIHRHRPELINFDSLKKENVYENNKLAFQVAEEQLGIPALLDAEDMVALKVPDRLSILTYVSQYYNYFHGRCPIGGMAGIKRPADGSTEHPAGKKPVSAKVFPSSGPAKENDQPPDTRSKPALASAPAHTLAANLTTNTKQDVSTERSHQTGTLNNKCVCCDKHVHLVQRHLVDGKLYHRNCAKSLTSDTNTSNLHKNPPLSRLSPDPDPAKTCPSPSRMDPTWPNHKATSPSSVSSSLSPPQAGPSASAKADVTVYKPHFIHKPTSTTTPTVTTTFTPTPRTSVAAKNLQAKLKFFQLNDTGTNAEVITGARNVDVSRGQKRELTPGQAVTVGLHVTGQDTTVEKSRGESRDKGSEHSRSKASAAAFISKKLTEENNNKPLWTASAKTPNPNPNAKTPAKLNPVEAPKKEPEAVRGRVKLRANPSLLSDLNPPATARSPSPARTMGPGRPAQPRSTSPNTSAVSVSESPTDWRARLKPVSSPVASSQSSPKPWTNGAGKTQTVDPPRPNPAVPSPSILVTAPADKGFSRDTTAHEAQTKTPKTKQDYIPTEQILKELQEIEDSVNELEKRGVELEVRLRSSEEDGEEESVMDELMVEWFALIRNKQVAMRRESELVYIARTQELEEQQPSVEQELRILLDKPEHLKTACDRRKEEELMEKLVGIVNDRNAIVEGLDEDRLREDEEDEQLNKMMMNFNLKKDKTKKKSPMSRLFVWGAKKEA